MKTSVSTAMPPAGLLHTPHLPAWSQIWASVIQGWRGPCLGALLCREEAASDSACSTREAAIDVACTEPGEGAETRVMEIANQRGGGQGGGL